MPDTPSDLLQLLFQRAMQLPAPARRAFVDRKCTGDAQLRQRLCAMLAAADAQFREAPATLPTPPAAPAAAAAAAPAGARPGHEGPGSVIGPYRLLQLLGEGGFGAVYLAAQSRPVAREVALKILKLGMDTEQVVARFEQERQALALMDHPHIAKVFDAGCTATGRPFFVMELCRGEPIVDYCDKNSLTIAERLELLEQACRAIQHAHGKGIVHRDIKPSNVLVGVQDGRPSVKVIDFGIAKAIAQPLTERPLLTEQQQVIGTLQYMSPEQAEGSIDIDTRTDIYALGVLLYELLTGSTPFDRRTLLAAGYSEMQRLIREQEPQKPSTRLQDSGETLAALAAARRVEPRRLGPLVRGELDWIALKAIEKDRTRRYETADALAQDLLRFRRGEAVVAAPPSHAYRLRKFVRRNRAAVAGAAAVTLSLLTGLVAFAWQASIAADERDEARAAQSRGEEVVHVMESLFKGIDPSADETVAGSFKDRLIERLDTVGARLVDMRDPLARARLEQSFAGVRLGLGDHVKAAAALRSCWQARERTLGPQHPDTVSAALDLAWAMSQAGQPQQAVELAAPVAAQRLADPTAPIAERRRIQHTLGLIHHAADDYDQAIAIFEALHAAWDAEPGPDTDDRLDALQALGAIYRQANQLSKALPILRAAYTRRQALLGPVHSSTLISANSLGVALMAEHHVDEAITLLTSVREGMLQRLPADHPIVITVESNLGGAHLAAGRTTEALELFAASHQRCLARFGAESPHSGQAGWALAHAHVKLGDDAQAADLMARSYPAMARAHGHDNRVICSMRRTYAECLVRVGRIEHALDLLSTTSAQWQQTHGAGHPFLVDLRWERGAVLCSAQRWTEALPLLRDVAAAFAGDSGRLDDRLAVMLEIGTAQLQAKQPADALATLEPLLPECIEHHGADDPRTLETQAALGAALWMTKQFDRSLPLLKDALARMERVLGPDVQTTVRCALNLAANYKDAERRDDFIATLVVWLPRAVARFGPKDHFVLELADQMGFWCHETGRLGDSVLASELVYGHFVAEQGPDAADTLATGRNFASALWFIGQYDRSVPLLEDLAARYRKTRGEDDPETLFTMGNLAVNLRDAGRLAEAIDLFADTIRRGQALGAGAAPELDFVATEYLSALARAGRRDEALAVAKARIEAIRRQHPPASLPLAGELNGVAILLLEAGMFEQAEAILRDVVAVRDAQMPDAWQTCNSRALLGEALSGLGQFAAAEPLVTGGGEGLLARQAKVPRAPRDWVAEASARVRRFYAAWAAAAPGQGQEARLQAWLEKVAPATPPPAGPAPAGPARKKEQH